MSMLHNLLVWLLFVSKFENQNSPPAGGATFSLFAPLRYAYRIYRDGFPPPSRFFCFICGKIGRILRLYFFAMVQGHWEA